MNRTEFLKNLKECLELSLEKEEINSQVDYYDRYISDEIAKGRTEKEVLDELGDPRLIAKTIKTVSSSEHRIDDSTSSDGYNDRQNDTTHNKSSARRNGPFVYASNNSIIGCAIVFLVAFIIIVSLLRFLGYIALGSFGMAYGFSPFGIIIMILLISWLFGSNRRH